MVSVITSIANKVCQIARAKDVHERREVVLILLMLSELGLKGKGRIGHSADGIGAKGWVLEIPKEPLPKMPECMRGNRIGGARKEGMNTS